MAAPKGDLRRVFRSFGSLPQFTCSRVPTYDIRNVKLNSARVAVYLSPWIHSLTSTHVFETPTILVHSHKPRFHSIVLTPRAVDGFFAFSPFFFFAPAQPFGTYTTFSVCMTITTLANTRPSFRVLGLQGSNPNLPLMHAFRELG